MTTEKLEALAPAGPGWFLVASFSWKPTESTPVSAMWENSTLQVRSISSVIRVKPIGLLYYVSCVHFKNGSPSRRPSDEELKAIHKAYDLSPRVKEYVPSDDCVQRGFYAQIPSREPAFG